MAKLSKRNITWVLLVVVVVALIAVVLPATCQPAGGPPGGQGGGFDGRPPGPPPGMGGAALVVADGVVYVASEGNLMAFEAKTLRKLGEASYGSKAGEPPR